MNAKRFQVEIELPLAPFALDVAFESDARALGLFGPSGAGKTSLLECLVGWRRPVRGRIAVEGQTLLDTAQGRSVPLGERRVGYVPQEGLLWPHWSVERNIRVAAAGRDAERMFAETVAVLEIGHLLARSIGGLSGGERQRVALARALVAQPALLVLDEPLGALDAPLRRRILPYLLRVREHFGVPTLYVSHDATEVQALCEEVIVLRAGRVVAQGAPRAVLADDGGEHGRLENVLRGVIAGIDGSLAEVQLEEGGALCVPVRGATVGERLVLALRSEDVLIALDVPTRISARNVLAARVVRVGEPGVDGAVRVDVQLTAAEEAAEEVAGEVSGAELSALLTRASVAELGIAVGCPVHLVFKTNACRVLSAPPD